MSRKDAISANVAARKAAEEVFGLAIDEAGTLVKEFDSGAVARFWVELRALVDETIPGAKPKSPSTIPPKMTDQQSRAFGKREMPRGQHTGEPVDDVARSYLDYWVEPDEFTEELKRYLRSDQIRSEPD